ncbi:MAG: glycosyltransferase family 2 protein [Armatimonadetes bacterium]|nr:glycosyltransferase family 2 protein [Armatimonadota bacterium]
MKRSRPGRRPSSQAGATMRGESSANEGPFFSIIIPARNERAGIEATCRAIIAEFADQALADYEILVINDHSTDDTAAVLQRLAAECPQVRAIENGTRPGFGTAVACGLEAYRGECACIVMGDLSDAPADIVAYYRLMRDGHECVFGSRFIRGARVVDYPWPKLVLNRLANWFIQVLFRLPLNDTTNAFKCYRREVIEGLRPLLSHHFNLTVELPLKAVVRGYEYTVIPISWTNRKTGLSKLRLQEMGSRYLFIVLYVWLEKSLSRGDYRR